MLFFRLRMVERRSLGHRLWLYPYHVVTGAYGAARRTRGLPNSSSFQRKWGISDAITQRLHCPSAARHATRVGWDHCSFQLAPDSFSRVDRLVFVFHVIVWSPSLPAYPFTSMASFHDIYSRDRIT